MEKESKPSESSPRRLRCTITTKLHLFSFCNGVHSAFTDYDCDSELYKHLFKVTFYANGNCTENEGHVSIIFEISEIHKCVRLSGGSVTFSCVASVVDVSGNKRFPQSFAYFHDVVVEERKKFPASLLKGFGFERYIQRSTLLSDSSNLLPNDTLTLCLEIDFEIIQIETYSKDETDVFHVEDGQVYIPMNSKFGRDLCEVSSVFKDMVEFSGVRNGLTDLVSIPHTDSVGLSHILKLLHENAFEDTVSGLCEVYVVADKYDVRPIFKLCPRLLVCIMHAINTKDILEHVDEDIHLISELLERFDNKGLRKVLWLYSDIKKKLLGGVGELDSSSYSKRDKTWGCEHVQGIWFRFFKIKRGRVEMDAFK